MRRAAELARGASSLIDLQWSATIAALRRVAPRARGRLLDVGCGDKPYQRVFAPYVTAYVGVEHEASFTATHASTSPGSGGGPDHLYDGERLPFDDGAFDTVLSVQVLEHTPRPAGLVAEMARVLAPEGRLILMAPFSFRLHEEPHDYFRFSPHGLSELCSRAGLRVSELVTVGGFWSLLGHKLNSFLAFRVARMGSAAQRIGKLGHERPLDDRPRYWALPVVGPTMLAVVAAARVLDRVAPDASEALAFLVVAEHETTPASRVQA